MAEIRATNPTHVFRPRFDRVRETFEEMTLMAALAATCLDEFSFTLSATFEATTGERGRRALLRACGVHHPLGNWGRKRRRMAKRAARMCGDD